MPGERRWIAYKRHWIPVVALGLGLAATAWWLLSPWPAALLIRAIFDQNAQKTVEEMTPFVPVTGVDARRDIAYGTGPDATFDLFRPSGASEPLPTVIWIHGGAWISGTKENVDPYVQIIASHGYTTVSLDYPYGPEHLYPRGLEDLNDALTHLVENADEYGIDPERLVIAGDSAGANLTSQLAVLTTNPQYADLLGMDPALGAEQLRGVVLNCGIYDVSGIPNAPGIGGWGFRIALWAYLGERDWSRTAGGQEMSTLDYVTEDFPTTWISGGNGDPLTDTQSKPLADKLGALGVDVETVFYPADHEPELPHEYQFHLDYADAQSALTSTLEYLDRVLRD
ncbi:acetyl esterase/lipase [Microbacteriaceae bacterium SG_E_30_P1]|uniref:Acetyl esterase/lipase n=1 Tax=Antiquaquibacter oligotrophicus TaxID=2880260 RepID=A0ABT6KNJ7_9MICO|nr:alpha/beta hydrolase [Antiquaquibacter oligotrophicus]MDH6181330.1 acetyl esterase/lipase [Antiquaquibacter oligotrophicus]UDF12977.1 alpha/beta hydrolase [Antiquaquibacter oligotrophicus]